MTCANCRVDSVSTASGLCLRCGSILHISGPTYLFPEPEERLLPQVLAYRGSSTARPGPLLTRSATIDAVLGFCGELSALALLLYGIFVIVQSFALPPFGGPRVALLGLGAILTAAMMYHYTKMMRVRYPNFARGWRNSRIGLDHLLTLATGAIVSVALFPIGYALCYIGMALGPVGWVASVILVYLVGSLARRINQHHKKHGRTRP